LVSNFFQNVILLGSRIIDDGIAKVWRVFEVKGIAVGVGEAIATTVMKGKAKAVAGPGGIFGFLDLAGGINSASGISLAAHGVGGPSHLAEVVVSQAYRIGAMGDGVVAVSGSRAIPPLLEWVR
jgi:hypothetical protein